MSHGYTSGSSYNIKMELTQEINNKKEYCQCHMVTPQTAATISKWN